MNFLTAASHKTFRHMLRNGFATGAGNLESEKVVEKMNRLVTYNALINGMSKAEELSRAVVEFLDRTRRLSPNETTHTSLIDSLCKHNRCDDAYMVLNEMTVNGFSRSSMSDPLKDVFCGFLRTRDMRKAFEMRYKMRLDGYDWWEEDGIKSWFLQGLSDEVTYTSLMNAYLDEGEWKNARHLFYDVLFFRSLPLSVIHSVIINGLDNKARTTEIKKHLLSYNYKFCLYRRPILEFHSTMVENSSDDDDEFKSVAELVEGISIKGLENVFDTILKSNYKPDGIDDGIVYNLFIFAHCKHSNVDEAYIMYKDMVHYGFACHMFTVLALIKIILERKNMVNELLWVIQNVLRSCNLNDSEIVKFLNEFNPEEPDSELALFEVLAIKAKDGLFLKCSYAPPSA